MTPGHTLCGSETQPLTNSASPRILPVHRRPRRGAARAACRRHVGGASLGWYDYALLTQYGWEDVEFGYGHMLQSGVPSPQRVTLAKVEDLAHNDRFRRGSSAETSNRAQAWRCSQLCTVPTRCCMPWGVDPETRQAPPFRGSHRRAKKTRRERIVYSAPGQRWSLIAANRFCRQRAAGEPTTPGSPVAHWSYWTPGATVRADGQSRHCLARHMGGDHTPDKAKTLGRASFPLWTDLMTRGRVGEVGWSIARSAMLRAMEQPSGSHVAARGERPRASVRHALGERVSIGPNGGVRHAACRRARGARRGDTQQHRHPRQPGGRRHRSRPYVSRCVQHGSVICDAILCVRPLRLRRHSLTTGLTRPSTRNDCPRPCAASVSWR